jgi:hypothetical protein
MLKIASSFSIVKRLVNDASEPYPELACTRDPRNASVMPAKAGIQAGMGRDPGFRLSPE